MIFHCGAQDRPQRGRVFGPRLEMFNDFFRSKTVFFEIVRDEDNTVDDNTVQDAAKAIVRFKY